MVSYRSIGAGLGQLGPQAGQPVSTEEGVVLDRFPGVDSRRGRARSSTAPQDVVYLATTQEGSVASAAQPRAGAAAAEDPRVGKVRDVAARTAALKLKLTSLKRAREDCRQAT